MMTEQQVRMIYPNAVSAVMLHEGLSFGVDESMKEAVAEFWVMVNDAIRNGADVDSLIQIATALMGKVAIYAMSVLYSTGNRPDDPIRDRLEVMKRSIPEMKTDDFKRYFIYKVEEAKRPKGQENATVH